MKGEEALRQSARELHSGIIWEGLGLLQADVAHDDGAAADSFALAQQFYTDPDDIVRAAIHRAHSLKAADRSAEELAEVRQVIKAFPNLAATNLLRELENQLSTEPAVTPASK